MRTHKKWIAAALGVAAFAGVGSAAYAYFTATGSGTGTGAVGNPTPFVIHGGTATYSGSATALLPGVTATIPLTVDNNSSGNQYMSTISVSSITADATHTGCDTATNPTWFTTGTDTVNKDFSPGTGQSAGSITVTMNDIAVNQDVCEGATLTFNFSSN